VRGDELVELLVAQRRRVRRRGARRRGGVLGLLHDVEVTARVSE
jgi:hypothetical protein